MGLLKDKFRNEKDDAPWSQEETDKFLNWLFEGVSFIRIARRLKRDEWSPEMRLNHILYTPTDKWIQDYRPSPIREDRAGTRVTPMDRTIMEWHKQNRVPLEVTARFLMRPVRELPGNPQVVKEEPRSLQVDIVLAHRYLYHMRQSPVISDHAYDTKKAKLRERGLGGFLLKQDPTRLASYPPGIRDLALYLEERYKDRVGTQ